MALGSFVHIPSDFIDLLFQRAFSRLPEPRKHQLVK